MIVIQLYNLDKTFKYANKKAIYKIYNKNPTLSYHAIYQLTKQKQFNIKDTYIYTIV